MTASGKMRQYSDKAKGRALTIKGRITGNRRTKVRGELVQARGEMRALGHRLAGKLRRVAHR